MKNFFRVMTAIVLLGLSQPLLAADVVVIVNKSNDQPVEPAFVSKAFTGAVLSWPDGKPIAVHDHSDEAVRGKLATLIGKTPANIKAAWASLMFSGKATPPKVAGGDAEVKAAVAANQGAIGYINASAVDSSVKVVLK